MVRVVLKTLAGEQVAVHEVPGGELLSYLAQIATRADLCVYIDGKPIPLHAAEPTFVGPVAAAHEVATAPVIMAGELAPAVTTVEDVRTLSGALSTVLGDMTRSFQRFAECYHQALEQQLDMQRDMADEMIRQRRLTGQSLGDIDLMHRAVKAAELNESMVERKARTGHTVPQVTASAPEVGVTDLIRGAQKLFGSKKQ